MFSFDKLDTLVRSKGINFAELARETGLYSHLFYEWKKGKSCPKADKIKVIADYFGVTIEYFFKDSDEE